MPEESENSSNIQECEMFVFKSANFDRLNLGQTNDSFSETVIVSALPPVDRSQSLEELREFVESSERVKEHGKQGRFVGFLTAEQVEKEVFVPGQFVTYYQIDKCLVTSKPPLDSQISLRLFVCYLNTRLQHRHYPIMKSFQSSYPKTFFQLCHYDPLKSSREPIFTSIKCLLKHYTQFVYVDSISRTGEIRVEVFPK